MTNTTILGIEEYTIDQTPNLLKCIIGPKVRFEVEEYDFDRLVRELVEYEQEFGLSSLEMFSQYIHGDLDEKMEEWLNLFILYLGTGEVTAFVRRAAILDE